MKGSCVRFQAGAELGQAQSPMYKRQVDPIFFPQPDRRDQYSSPFFFLMKILFWSPDPLNKGKIKFFIAFLSSLRLILQEYLKKQSKNP